jgi:hypothetical protein
MTKRKSTAALVFGIILVLTSCSKRNSQPQVVVKIPAGFSGNFILEMGTRSAPALPMEDGAYLIVVPPDGKVTTSTFVEKPKVAFNNSSEGSVWGYSEQVFTTGDGISIGGKIEFFVGTKTQFDAEQNKKNHSGTSSVPVEAEISG